MASPPGVNYPALAAQFATQAGINPTLFQNQIRQESGFNPAARSSAGAVGIAQIVPRYHPGVNVGDPTASLKWAAGYMAGLVHKYGSYEKALSVYNSGKPNSYLDPNFAGGQTYRYVRNIMGGKAGIDTNPGAGAPSGSGPSGNTGSPRLPFDPQALQTLFTMLGLPVVPGMKAGTGAGLPPGAASPAPAPQPTHSGSTVPFLEQFAQPFGVKVTSTTTGEHAPHSYHYQGRAVDFGGQNYQHLAALANAAIQHPQDFREMFYTGPGHPNFFIKNGRLVPLAQLDPGLYREHENHVHLAA